jgi:hypothetical protein
MKNRLFAAAAVMTLLLAMGALSASASEKKPIFKAHFEIGWLSVLDHKIQFGNDGTYFDYAAGGGQDNIYAVTRMSLDLRLSRRGTLVFLYQPLALETKAILQAPLRVDGLDFPAGTPTRFVYLFPFYRLSYLHDFSKNPATELSLGLSLHIRNAPLSSNPWTAASSAPTATSAPSPS